MAENYRIMSQCLQHEKSGEKEGEEEGRVESVFKKIILPLLFVRPFEGAVDL